MEAHAVLDKPCPNSHHANAGFAGFFSPYEFNPKCQTCSVRKMLSAHDHLHLDGSECLVPGITGTPGVSVKCSCGAFHH